MYSSIKNNIIRRIRTAIDLKRENIFLKKNDFKLSKTKDYIEITNNKESFTLRKMGSDWRAFKQIFQYEEYKPVVKALKLNKIVPTLILDLGANIGLVSIYLKTSFPESEIICVEPDENNFKQLRLNTNNLLKITLLNVAVWNKPTSLVEVEDEPFRGGEDWSKSFKEQTIKHSKVIEALSINQILKKAKNPIIDLLKIDIEGAERFIFNKEISDLTFLKVTRCIAIEIHDEFGIREQINQILTDYKFTLFEAGELTIGIKMTIAIKVENLSKAYQLGQIGTGTISRDLERWYARFSGKEDPFSCIGEINHYQDRKSETNVVWSLKDINFEIEQGDAVGIIGRNGAGKSTLLKILSKVTAPTTGKITGKGRIASLLEVGTGFHPELSGRENIFLNGAILGMRKKEIQRKLDEIVSFAGIERYLDTPVKRYSSGMYVRLAFAVAAHLESEILIVDEVLAVGDAEFQRKCLGKMNEISKSEGRTVLFVSHNIEAVNSLCNNLILLNEGKMQYQGSVGQGYSLYQKDLQKELKSSFVTPPSNELENSTAYISSINLMNPSFSGLANDESFIFSIKVRSNKKIEKHRIGIRISTTDYKPVGLLFTASCIDLNEGDEAELQIVLSNHNLSKGTYAMDFSLGTGNEEEAIKDLQIISDALIIQITKKHQNSETKISNWNKLNWGDCRFNSISTNVKLLKSSS